MDDNDNMILPVDAAAVFLLVYIGRLAKEKRLQDLKAILHELNHQRNIRTRLCLVGHGPQMEELQEYFKDTTNTNTPTTTTTFLGPLEGTELSQAFASADVFVMPSDSETLGFVVLESMASGVPVVAAKAGGLIDLIHHEQTGYLVPTVNVAAFCDCIETLYRNDKKVYQQMALAGRQETERWSWYASMEHVTRDVYPQAILNFSHRWEQRALRWLRRPFG
jgi:sulfoquinovosyltransferase